MKDVCGFVVSMVWKAEDLGYVSWARLTSKPESGVQAVVTEPGFTQQAQAGWRGALEC